MTGKNMEFAATLVKSKDDPYQKAVVVDAFVDLFRNANYRFSINRFLDACGITNDEYQKMRGLVYRLGKE